jgi:hypothetical protein
MNQRFFVASVLLPRHPAIATIINQKLSSQQLPINEIYNLIIENSKAT